MALVLNTGIINAGTVSNYVNSITGDVDVGSNQILNVSSVTDLIPGLVFDPSNVAFPSGTIISAIAGNTVTVNNPATTTEYGSAFDLYCPSEKYYCPNATISQSDGIFDATGVTVGWLVYCSSFYYASKILRFRISDITNVDGSLISCYIEYNGLGNLDGEPLNSGVDWPISEPTANIRLGGMISSALYPNVSFDPILTYAADASTIIDQAVINSGGGAAKQIIEQFTAGANLEANRAVILEQLTNKIVYAPLTSPDVNRIIGITATSIAQDAQGDVIEFGMMTDASWAWDTNIPIYLGADGTLTQTTPTSGYMVVLAKTMTATQILVNPQTAIDLDAGPVDYDDITDQVDGINAVFTVTAGKYFPGSLKVYNNGNLERKGADKNYTETSAINGTFTFTTPPIAGTEIIVSHR